MSNWGFCYKLSCTFEYIFACCWFFLILLCLKSTFCFSFEFFYFFSIFARILILDVPFILQLYYRTVKINLWVRYNYMTFYLEQSLVKNLKLLSYKIQNVILRGGNMIDYNNLRLENWYFKYKYFPSL